MSDAEDDSVQADSPKRESRSLFRRLLGPAFIGGLLLAIISAMLERLPISWLSGEQARPSTTASAVVALSASPSPSETTSPTAEATSFAPGSRGAGTGTGNTGGGAKVVIGPTTLTATAALDDPLNGDPVNLSPVHNVRPLSIRVADTNGNLVYESQKGASQVPGTDRYIVMFTLPTDWVTAPYQVRIRLDYTLWQLVEGVPTITKGAANQLPVAAPIPGDVNQDNKVNTDDYDIIMACYSDFQPAKGPCDSNQRRGADLNDDFEVNAPDYNLYLRIMSARGGG